MVELGRFLERLQQRVLALLAHRLGLLDDEHAARAFERTVDGRANHLLAQLLDQVLAAARDEPDEVGVWGGIEQRPAARRLRVGGAGGQDLGGEGPCRRPLAGAARAAEQVGVGRAGGERCAKRKARPWLVLGRGGERGGQI